MQHRRLLPKYLLLLSAGIQLPDFPVPFGVLRQVHKPTYDELLEDQVEVERRVTFTHLLQPLEKGAFLARCSAVTPWLLA